MCIHTHTHALSKVAGQSNYILFNVEIEKCSQTANVSGGSVRCHVPSAYKRHLNASNSGFLQHINCILGMKSLSISLSDSGRSSPVPVLIESTLLCCLDLIVSRFLIDLRCLIRQCTRSLTKVINFHFVQGSVPIRSPGWGRQGG